MTKPSSRLVIILCMLLVVQEFGHARRHTAPVKRELSVDEETKDDEVNSEEEAEDQDLEMEMEMEDANVLPKLRPQTPSTQEAGKKGWVSAVFKGFKIGGEIANIVMSAAAMATAIYQAVHGCCGELQEPKLCDYEEKFEIVKKEVETLSNEADDLQAKAEDEQLWIGSDLDEYEQVLTKLKQINDEQKTFIQSIHPTVRTAMNTAKSKIMKVMTAKNNTAEGVKYLEIEGVYKTTVENAMNIMFPAMGLAFPAAKTLVKAIWKKRKTNDVMQIADAEYVDVKVPGNKKLQGKTKIGKFMSKYRTKLKSMKTKLNTRFGKAAKYAKTFKAGLGASLKYAFAGFELFSMIKGREQCREIKEYAFQALNNVTLARDGIKRQKGEILQHLKVMNQAWSYLKGNVTDDDFLASLASVKEMVDDLAKNSDEMKQTSTAIQTFLDTIKSSTNYKKTFYVLKALLDELFKVPFTVSCYTSKFDIINVVIDKCSEGRKSFDTIYKEAHQTHGPMTDFGTTPTACEDKVGFKYINKKDVRKAWKARAKQEGRDKICLMNYKFRVKEVCGMKEDWYEASDVADELSMPEEDAQTILNNCPLLKDEKKMVCAERKKGLRNKAIAKQTKLAYKYIKKVTCPRPLDHEEQKEACLLKDKGKSDEAIAGQLEVEIILVQKQECPVPLDNVERRYVCKKRKAGWSDGKIATKLKVPVTQVSGIQC